MNKRSLAALILGVIVFFGGIYTLFSLETIKQGHVGVVFSKNGGVIHKTLSQGMHFINPMERVTEYPISLDHVKYESISLATKDGKPITIDIEYDYKNDIQKIPEIFNTWKGMKPKDIEANFLRSRAREAAAAVTSKYTILEIFQNYESIKTEIGEKFSDSVVGHGFIVENFMLGTPTPDESTAKAIQAVVDAQQQLEALKIETQKAEEQAKKQKIEAEGQAAAKVAKAKGEAEANRILSQSITPELLKKMEMEARIEHGWITVQGASAVVTDK